MKILFISPYVPNLIRVRPYQLLRSLVQRGHSVTLATLWTTPEERAELQPLTELGIRVVAHELTRWRSLRNSLLTLPTPLPLQAFYCWHPALARSVQNLLKQDNFDVVHIEHLRGARYGVQLKSAHSSNGRSIPVTWDSVDCISHLFEQASKQSRSLQSRWITRLELGRTRAYEGQLVRQFDQVVVTSPTDKAALEELAKAANPSANSALHLPEKLNVVANGVDLDYFSLAQDEREPDTVVFSGKMSYHANSAAALRLVHDIMPRVWRQRPEVKVWLVGKDPTAELLALADSKDGDGTHPQGRVTVTGTVPDLRPYLWQAALAVAPLTYGAGIQNKVLEAMACGAAVIASPQACSALQTQPGRDLLVAETDDAFAQAILNLLERPARQRELGQAARHYVEHHHSWDAAAACFEQIYHRAILPNGAPQI